jgi:nucleotide-binding universal stress UspA family protein
VLHRSHRPVVVVPNCELAGESTVVAYDASPAAVRALESFGRSGLDEGRPVYVVSVSGDSELARRRADEAVAYLDAFRIRATAIPSVGKSAAGPILAEAKTRVAGLIVMGAFGHQRSEGLFGGSTTGRVLDSTQAPLFIHH